MISTPPPQPPLPWWCCYSRCCCYRTVNVGQCLVGAAGPVAMMISTPPHPPLPWWLVLPPHPPLPWWCCYSRCCCYRTVNLGQCLVGAAGPVAMMISTPPHPPLPWWLVLPPHPPLPWWCCYSRCCCYRTVNVGQCLVGAAGPVAMAAPPVLSAVWFPPTERTTCTAIAYGLTMLLLGMGFIVG